MPRLQLKNIKDRDYVVRNMLVIALARSGYHAVCHWLCKKLPGQVIFMNNCNHMLQFRNRFVYTNTNDMVRTRIYTFENFDLRGFKELGMQRRFDNIIIVNRDPFNWIASSMKKGAKLQVLNRPVPASKVLEYSKWTCESMSRIDMFIQYMKQCLGEEDFLGESFMDINYNKWFADEEYRKNLCEIFDVPFSDDGLDYVPQRGGGSSFDRQKYQGRGSQMEVLDRWKVYKKNRRYNRLLTEEIRNYSRKYFNYAPF